MDNCDFCEGCGCPKCLGIGYDLSKIIEEIKHPLTKEVFKVEDYNNLTVAQQRAVKDLIHALIKVKL